MQEALAQPNPPALRRVTHGAQPVGSVPISADQAVLLGLGRVIALEHPELDCRLVDLPLDVALDASEGAPREAREAAWRDGGWHVPRLVRAALSPDPEFSTSGVHLITGGLGGLGPPLAANWLRAHGAERVVLMARTARPDVTLADGVEVMVGDVAIARDVDRVVAAIDAVRLCVARRLPSCRDLERRGNTDPDTRRPIWPRSSPPKSTGARNLETATGDRSLDAFVLFGSSAGLIGNPGQAAHAAANAYLGVLADARRQRGLAGLCIDWGAWGEAGTMTRSAIGDRLVAAGAALMAPEHAFGALGRALVANHRRLMIAAIDWPRFLAGYGERVPAFFAAVAPTRRATAHGAVRRR